MRKVLSLCLVLLLLFSLTACKNQENIDLNNTFWVYEKTAKNKDAKEGELLDEGGYIFLDGTCINWSANRIVGDQHATFISYTTYEYSIEGTTLTLYKEYKVGNENKKNNLFTSINTKTQ